MKNKTAYREAVGYIYGLQKYGIKFGLSKTSDIMKTLGNPHHNRRYIHIAGSNGKGSVAAILESILIRSGRKVGFYSSPHLVRFTERFRINRKEIPQEKATEIITRLKRVIDPDHPPTFFEVTTAMALVYFAEEETDIAIMEVGMGGRLDATNIIRPLVSAITNISLEHQFFLGSRLIDIAKEKAGIIKKGVDLVTAATQPRVKKFFETVCKERKAPFWRVGRDVRYRSTGQGFSYYGFNRSLTDLKLGLKGRFQNRNAVLALAMIEILEKKGIKISTRDITEGLTDIAWPGRMQIISKEPFIVLDGAHNPNAVRELAGSIDKDFSYKRLLLVIGVMEDKDIAGIIRSIIPKADHIICTSPGYYRSADPEELMRIVSGLGRRGDVIPVISDAIERARQVAGPRDMILITGSLFTVGEALTYLDPVRYRADGF